jgi:hypothetical protein
VPDSLLTYETEPDPADETKLVATDRIDRDITIRSVSMVMLTGYSLRLDPWTSLRSIDMIKGTPALRAHAMFGLAQRDGHRFHIAQATMTRCVIFGLRLGASEWQTFEWTTERARQAGLFPGQPGRMWQKMTQNMLVARTKSEAARTVGADSLLGGAYSAEELRDGLLGVAEFTDPDDEPGKRKRRRAVPVIPALPAGPSVAGAAVHLDDTGRPAAGEKPMNAAMRKAMFARFGRAGIDDEAVQLDLIREWAGDPSIEHRDKLSIRQANLVLAELDKRIKNAQQRPEGGEQ